MEVKKASYVKNNYSNIADSIQIDILLIQLSVTPILIGSLRFA